jgi:hypothetical protein
MLCCCATRYPGCQWRRKNFARLVLVVRGFVFSDASGTPTFNELGGAVVVASKISRLSEIALNEFRLLPFHFT